MFSIKGRTVQSILGMYFVYFMKNKSLGIERLPSRQAQFNGTDRLWLDVHGDYQTVTRNQGYFEGCELNLN